MTEGIAGNKDREDTMAENRRGGGGGGGGGGSDCA